MVARVGHYNNNDATVVNFGQDGSLQEMNYTRQIQMKWCYRRFLL